MGILVQQPGSFLGRVEFNCVIDALVSPSEAEAAGARFFVASSDDLLGLGHDARVREAGFRATKAFGINSAFGLKLQQELEERIAAHFRVEAALVVADEHAVLAQLPWWQLAYTQRSQLRADEATPVATVEDAETILSQPSLIGLFAEAIHVNEGDLAPLSRLAEGTLRTRTQLIVYDIGLGILGPTGGGAVEHLSVQQHVQLTLLRLGLGVPGGGLILLGNTETIAPLRGHFRPPTPFSLACTLKGFEIALAEPGRRERLFDNAQSLLGVLKSLAFDTGPTVTPWIPVWLGDETLCQQWLAALKESNVACKAWLAGPRSRLLFSLAATASDAELERLTAVLERLCRKLPFPEATASHRVVSPLARPGSYATAAPATLHWTTIEPRRDRRPPPAPPTAPLSAPIELSLKERLFDAVETITWRTASRGAQALRAVLDTRRR